MKRIIPILLIFILTSCGIPGLLDKNERKALRQKNRCNRKLERVIAKCPDLLNVDTIEIPVVTLIDSQAVSKSFTQNKDVSGVDTIISKYQRIIDSIFSSNGHIDNGLLTDIGDDIKRYIISRPCLEDEIRIDTSIVIMIDNKKYELKVSFGARPDTNNAQEIFLEVPQTEFKASVSTTKEVITRVELTDKEWLYQKSKAYWWVPLLILGIILFVRAIKKL